MNSRVTNTPLNPPDRMLELVRRLSQSYDANVAYHAGLQKRRTVAGRPRRAYLDSQGEYCPPTVADIAPSVDDNGVPY